MIWLPKILSSCHTRCLFYDFKLCGVTPLSALPRNIVGNDEVNNINLMLFWKIACCVPLFTQWKKAVQKEQQTQKCFCSVCWQQWASLWQTKSQPFLFHSIHTLTVSHTVNASTHSSARRFQDWFPHFNSTSANELTYTLAWWLRECNTRKPLILQPSSI